MHDISKDIELSKYRYSLAEETYRNAKMCLTMDFTEIVLIDPIMQYFMEYELFLRWKV